LGGWGLAVSRFSAHPREALELVRYLTRRDVQEKRSRVLSRKRGLQAILTWCR
jgi:trehalose/maltose transport system substrate-binding protein